MLMISYCSRKKVTQAINVSDNDQRNFTSTFEKVGKGRVEKMSFQTGDNTMRLMATQIC